MIGSYTRRVPRAMWNFLRVSRKSSLLATTSWCLASGVGYNWLGAMECDSNPGGVIVGESTVLTGVEPGVTGASVCTSGRGGNGEAPLWLMVSICPSNGEETDGAATTSIFETHSKKFYSSSFTAYSQCETSPVKPWDLKHVTPHEVLSQCHGTACNAPDNRQVNIHTNYLHSKLSQFFLKPLQRSQHF